MNGDLERSVEARSNGTERLSKVKASITVRLSLETSKGWMTIGATGDVEHTADANLDAVRRAKAMAITDAKDIVLKGLWEADIALEKALSGELKDEAEIQRIRSSNVHGGTE